MAMQLLLGVLVPVALLIGLTVLISSGRLSFIQTAVSFLARQNRICISLVMVLTATDNDPDGATRWLDWVMRS